MILRIIFIIVAILIASVIFKYNYKKCESIIERLFYITFVLLIIFVSLLYFLDSNNIPTIFNWSKNINTQNWIGYIMTISSALFAEIIGGLILIYVTRMQIDESNTFYLKRDKEERRINNLPLLTYSFLDFYTDGNNVYILPSKFDNDSKTEIVLKIKNIGMNAIRKCYVEINGKSLIKKCYCPLDIQSTLDKGEEKTIAFSIKLPTNTYKYSIVVYYEDLLHNWYNQEIILNYEVDNNVRYGINNYVKYDYIINDEKVINEPKIKFNIDRY